MIKQSLGVLVCLLVVFPAVTIAFDRDDDLAEGDAGFGLLSPKYNITIDGPRHVYF